MEGFLASLPFTIHTEGPLPWRRLWLSLLGLFVAQAGFRNIIEGVRYKPHREWVSHCIWGLLQVYVQTWYWPNVTWFALDVMTVIHYRRGISYYWNGDERVWKIRALVEGGLLVAWLLAQEYYSWFYVNVAWGLVWSPVAGALAYVLLEASATAPPAMARLRTRVK